MNKKELRAVMRSIRKGKNISQSDGIVPPELEALAEYLRDWNTILLYWSLDDEVGTHALVERLYKEDHKVLLPRVVSDTEMTLHPYAGLEQMRAGAWGILEPVTPSVDIATLDEGHDIVAVIPGMAFTADGKRLGRGKGYYDRMLKRVPYIYKVGLCYDWQMVEEVPTNMYDVGMDKVWMIG